MSATAENTFDIVILGGGSGGYACALRAAELDLSVALVEKGKLGGTCLHMGCIPTKALLHAAEVADTAREGEQFGVKTTFESVDMSRVNAYKDGVIGRLYKGLQGLVKSKSIEYVEGEGRLVAKNTVEVAGRRLVGRNVVLATGSYAKSLPGLDIGGRVMTSEQALFLDYVPNRVVVLGGGVIGVEFASVFKSFGAEVTIIEALPRLVALEDEEIDAHDQRANDLADEAEHRDAGEKLGARQVHQRGQDDQSERDRRRDRGRRGESQKRGEERAGAHGDRRDGREQRPAIDPPRHPGPALADQPARPGRQTDVEKAFHHDLTRERAG